MSLVIWFFLAQCNPFRVDWKKSQVWPFGFSPKKGSRNKEPASYCPLPQRFVSRFRSSTCHWRCFWPCWGLAASWAFFISRLGDPCGSLVYTGAAAIIASGSRARSPNWHRRQRRRRSVARRYIHLSRANGQVRVTPKLCRAIWILCDHHAQPRYKELYKMYRRKNQDQEWPAWSPGQWPKKQKSGKGGGKDGDEPTTRMEALLCLRVRLRLAQRSWMLAYRTSSRNSWKRPNP